jgi:hypothetical protein
MPPPLLISYIFLIFKEIYLNPCIQLMHLHITTLNYNVTPKKDVEETNSNTAIAGRGGVLVVPLQVSSLSPPAGKVLPNSFRGIIL